MRDAGTATRPKPGGTPPADAAVGSAVDAAVDSALATRVSEVGGTRLQVVCSRTGNALLQWDDGQQRPHYARWNAARGEWSQPESLDFVEANVIDPHRSGRPLVVGRRPGSRQDTAMLTARFDPGPDVWSPVHEVEGSRLETLGGLALDGSGSAYRFWRPGDRTRVFASDWSINREGWSAPQEVFEGGVMVGLPGDGALLWSDRDAFGARRFDLVTRAFGPLVEVRTRTMGLIVSTVAVGDDDAALAVFAERMRDGIELTVSDYEPASSRWQAIELALQVPAPGDGMSIMSPLAVIDTRFALVAQPVETADGRIDVYAAHRVGAQAWTFSGMFASEDPNARFEPVQDDAANVYASWSRSLLYHAPAYGEWAATPVAAADFLIFPASVGAFAVGFANRKLVAYHHPGELAEGDGWRLAHGLPSGTEPQIGSIPYAGCAFDNQRAIVVWPGNSVQQGIWAAFIEP